MFRFLDFAEIVPSVERVSYLFPLYVSDNLFISVELSI